MIYNELSNSAKIDLSKGQSGGGVVDLTGDEDPTDEDGDIGMGDSIGVSVYLGGGISWESNIGDSDNTGDGGTIVGDGIGKLEEKASLILEVWWLGEDITMLTTQWSIAESYDWDKEEVSFDDNEVPKVKALMAHADEERVSISKESAKNGEWIKISMKKCISKQIPTQKKKILGFYQLTEDSSSSRPKDLVFVKSLADNSEVSITGSNKSKLFEVEDSTLSNHDIGKHPLPPLEKLTGAKTVSGPKTIKSILKSKSTFKAKTLKGITVNEPSSVPARGNKSSLVSKTNSAPAGKLKNVKIDDPSLAIVIKEFNELKLQISKNKSSYFRNKKSQQIKQSKRGILINKERDVNDLLRMYDKTGSSVNTPIIPLNMLGPDLNGKAGNESQYKGFLLNPTGGIYGEVGLNTFRKPLVHITSLTPAIPAKATLKNSLLPPRWRLAMAHIIQCLGGKTRGFDQITNKGAIILYSLANGINIDYASIFWEDTIIKLNKNRKKVVPYTRFRSLLMMHKMKEGYKDEELSLYPTQVFTLFIIHSESASGNDASTAFIAEADLGNSALSNFVPQQQGMNEGTKNTSYDYLFAGTDPYVLTNQTKSVSEGLETVLTRPITRKGASFISRKIKEETSSIIKLEDLAKLVSHVQPSFKDLDSPEDDLVIVVDDSDVDKNDEVHAIKNVKTKDTSVPKSSSLSSLPTKLKDLPSKLNETTREVKGLMKQVHKLEIELPGDLKEIPTKLDDFTKNVTSLTSQVVELKTLQ
nr:hypothetical protein [Tanacetum cinerariifolium]